MLAPSSSQLDVAEHRKDGGEPTWIVATTSAVSLVKGGIAGSTTGDMWGGAPGRIAKAVLQNSCATPFVAVQSFYANEGKNISPY